jgi:type I restriction-modification system DNA methylase subunit
LQREYTEEEKAFLRSYTGYGGLGKYDKEASADVLRIMEFYTPNKVIEIMWGLAYKHGYKPDMSVLETSAGTGEFLKYAKQSSRIMAFEISRYSSAICKILYPYAEVIHSPFEKRFIDKNFTIKDNTENLPKFDLCIGNPPYASFERLDKIAAKYLLGMGEQKFTKANNYVEYFLRRSLDMLKPNGLLIQIVGAELMNGGSLFLDSNNSAVKTYLAQNAELLEAYRLPAGIFETTNVTSEILVIRKNA